MDLSDYFDTGFINLLKEEASENDINKMRKGIKIFLVGLQQLLFRQRQSRLNQGWILVEDDLPKNNISVEVTTYQGEREIARYDPKSKVWCDANSHTEVEVVAWKKPSNPYKMEKYQNIDYEDLIYSPITYLNEKVIIYGRVIEICEDYEETNENLMRVAVEDDPHDILIASYNCEMIHFEVAEKDYIKIYGTSTGVFSHITLINNSMEYPLIIVDRIQGVIK